MKVKIYSGHESDVSHYLQMLLDSYPDLNIIHISTCQHEKGISVTIFYKD